MREVRQRSYTTADGLPDLPAVSQHVKITNINGEQDNNPDPVLRDRNQVPIFPSVIGG